MEKKIDVPFIFDKQRGYRLLSITDIDGNDKSKHGFYKQVIGCTAIGLSFDQTPSPNGKYRMCIPFIHDADSHWINRPVHTSTVQQIIAENDTLTIYTENSIYILEETTLQEPILCNEKNILELYLGRDEYYHFAKGFYHDDRGEVKELVEHIHVGTFVDTVLIGLPDNSVWGEYLCRYFYRNSSVEFYNTLYNNQDYSIPMLIHNTSKEQSLCVRFEGFDFQWTINPGQSKRIVPFAPIGADEE